MTLFTNFLITLAPTLLLWNTLETTIPNEYISFLLIHLCLIPFILSQAPKRDYSHWLLWSALTIAHGMTHIYSHAFTANGDHNADYDPFPDYIVHGLQCATMAMYHPKLKLLACLMCAMVISAGYMAKVDKSFFETNAWIIISGMGVLGNHYQMMMLEDKNDNSKCSTSIYLQSAIIWFGIYAGYMIPFLNKNGIDVEAIVWWDGIMQEMGVFRVWMLNFGVAVAFERFAGNFSISSSILVPSSSRTSRSRDVTLSESCFIY